MPFELSEKLLLPVLSKVAVYKEDIVKDNDNINFLILCIKTNSNICLDSMKVLIFSGYHWYLCRKFYKYATQ